MHKAGLYDIRFVVFKSFDLYLFSLASGLQNKHFKVYTTGRFSEIKVDLRGLKLQGRPQIVLYTYLATAWY